VGARCSAPVQTGPGAHPASCTMCTGSFPGVKSGRGVTLTPYSLLVPWSRKGRAIPLLPLWAIQPVQSLSACIRVHFTLPLPEYAISYFIVGKREKHLCVYKTLCCPDMTSNVYCAGECDHFVILSSISRCM